MELIGHTMATPGRTARQAIALFAELGLAGAELVCRDGMALPPDTSLDEARRLGDYARALGCPVRTVTPYAWEINSADPQLARAHRDLLRHACDLAAALGARYVRAYGGKPSGESGAWERTVAALRESAAHAAERNLVILVENHPGTLTRTGNETRRLLDEAAHPSLRALYDPANVLDDTDESWETTLDRQRGTIACVHVKDFLYHDGKRRACCVGDGIVPWREILPRLKADGWDGPLSFEYEKMWYPDQLPDPEIGLPRSADFVRQFL
ncbi:MAG: sugar phosphate isomerase/epimerase family protein [Lentisphaeria bacterium]|jgi:sugar phosphate isomerase/epimerase|nr:sugar phosphate isomerase/epimerase family protein [Lentisphaeria bacterium]